MKRTRFILAALTLLATSPAFANDLDQLTEDEWWQKEGFGFGEGFYTQYKVKDLGKPMQGGGFAVGGEYINQETHFGIGGRFYYALVMQDYTGYKADDNLLGLDLFIPFRVSNGLTAYVGGGGTYHGFSLDFDEDRGIYGEDKWEQDGFAVTGNAFVGVRWRFFDHFYLFGEYRREFGKIDTVCTNYAYTRDFSHPKDEMDMSGNVFFVGLGGLF